MDENTQNLIQVVSKYVDHDKKDLALQFLLDTINEKQQQNYKNSIEMNKFILYEVNEYIKSLSRKPKIISFDDSVPKYENIDSSLERIIQERQYSNMDTFIPSNIVPIKKDGNENRTYDDSKMIIEQLNIDDVEKEEDKSPITSSDTKISEDETNKMMTNYNDRMILYDDAKPIVPSEKETMEDIKLNLSSIVWIDTIEQNEDHTLTVSLEKEWKKTVILQLALDKQYDTGDFIYINGTFFQKLGYTRDYKQYNLYKGNYNCPEDKFKLEIKTHPNKKLVEWSKVNNPLLIQIFHQH